MKRLTCHSVIFAIALLWVVIAQAQSGSSATKHYEKNGLSFDYPAGWTLTDSSSPSAQTLTFSRQGSTAQIVVSRQGGPTPACDSQSEREKIANALTEKVATQIQAVAAPGPSPVRTQIGTIEVEGTELHGVIDHQPVLGDVYSLRLNRHFVSLVFVRVDSDEPASSAWNTVRTTLKVEPPLLGVMVAPSNSDAKLSGGVLNGRALSLPKPGYPPAARQAHVGGTVVIQVTIDEFGTVISANAIDGHPLLRAVCVAAAREAQFSPTKLCGEPVRVTGVITYNFVAR